MSKHELILEVDNRNNSNLETLREYNYHPAPFEQITLETKPITEIDRIVTQYSSKADYIIKRSYSIFHVLYMRNIMPNPFAIRCRYEQELISKWQEFLIKNSRLLINGPYGEQEVIFNDEKTQYDIAVIFARFFTRYNNIQALEEKENQRAETGNYEPVLTKYDYHGIFNHELNFVELMNILKRKRRYLSLYRNINAYLEGTEELLESVPNREQPIDDMSRTISREYRIYPDFAD